MDKPEISADHNHVNRATRRAARYVTGFVPPAARILNNADDYLHKTVKKRNNLVDTLPGYAARIYQGDGAMLAYLDASRTFSKALSQVPAELLDKKFSEHAKGDEIYTYRLNGISLSDIEKMTADLGGAPIREVNRMLRENRFSSKTSRLGKLAKEQVVVAAAHPLARPDIPFPKQLEPLRQVASAYFDFYMPYIESDMAGTDREYLKFAFTLPWVGKTLLDSLGAYLPAYYGISASSAVKFLEDRTYNSPLYGGTKGWKRLFGCMIEEAKGAYWQKGLPEPISIFQQSNPENEEKVAQRLKEHYGGLSLTGVDMEATDQTILGLSELGKDLSRDISRSKDRHLTLALEHPVFEAVKVAKRSETLVFIGLLKGSQHHLLLEVNKRNQIFGAPYQLLGEFPHVYDLLSRDLMSPVVEEMVRRHPAAQQAIIPALSLDNEIKKRFSPEHGIQRVNEVTDTPVEEGKVRGLVNAVRAFVHFEPELPGPAEAVRQVFTVNHSRSQLRRLAGQGVKDEQLSGMMEAIKRFEYGLSGQAIQEENGRRFCEVEVEGRIMVLRFMGEGEFMLTQVKTAKDKLIKGLKVPEQEGAADLFKLAHPLRGFINEADTTADFAENIYPNELAKYGESMQTDIVLMLDSLRKEPKGEGTYFVQKARVKIERGVVVNENIATSAIKLRGFRGDLRGLDFTNPNAFLIRIAYYMHPTEDRTIVVQDILHHRDWDRKYVLQKSS